MFGDQNSRPLTSLAGRRPASALLPSRDEKSVTVNPLDSVLTNCDARNPFRIRSYRKCRVSLNGLQNCPSAKPSRMNTCKSVSKQRTLTPFRMNTYGKHRGRGIMANSLLLSTCGRSDVFPSVPLRAAVFGATIRNGTKLGTSRGKHIAPHRCLRLESGHRGLFNDVPGQKTPMRSGLQVVPGSSVLTRVSGFVLTNPEQVWTHQQGGPSAAS